MADTFETRYLGVSIEVEPVASADGLTVDLNEVFQSSAYLGDLKATGAGAAYGPQPIIQTRKCTTAQVIPTGRSVLVGTLNPPVADGASERTDAGRTWLVFVRATPNDP
jgi:type II secretory pathway component GspD/PulD (secretin)